MNIKHSIKAYVVIGFLFISIMGLLFPSTSASPEIDKDDGIWTDDFKYNNQTELDNNLLYKNCTVHNETGYVSLNKDTKGLVYDFRSGNHKAFWSRLNFFPIPIFSTPIRINKEFDNYLGYDRINNYGSGDDKTDYARHESTGPNHIVHRFKFDLEIDAEKLGNITIRWFGKGKDIDYLTLYYWKYFTPNKIFGYWEKLDENTTTDTDISLHNMLSEEALELALTDDGVINFCVVATSSSSIFQIMTNYVNITSLNIDSYTRDTATIETKNPINPGIDDFYWEIFSWNDYERGNATAKYQVYRNTSEGDILIENKYIKDNSIGLTDPPINLYLVPSSYNKLKIKAILSTDDYSVSPIVSSWTVTWQKETNKWQDNFNSTHRISTRTRIKIGDNLSIKPVSGDWPMFGQNPQNTRTSEGKGPSNQNSSKIYWISEIHEDNDATLTDPVISDEYLYLCTQEGVLYRYDFLPNKVDVFNGFNVKDKTIVSPPAITDEYIIIVTGETDNNGAKNFVFALNKNDNCSLAYSYNYGEDICYWSPPIVSDDKVFISTWSGDPDILQSNENNKIIALNIEGLTKEWEFDLPFHSFSAPAVSDEFVVVGCSEGSSDNLFVLDKETGELIWSESVGAIGKSSPVIYDNTVFVVSEYSFAGLLKTKVTAFRLDNGTALWEKKISIPMIMPLERSLGDYPHITMADSTPAVFDEKLYVTCPGGRVHALNIENGTEAWSQVLYLKDVLVPDILDSSPAIADGKIYISTPGGLLYSLDINNNSDKKLLGETEPNDKNIPFVTSPIISNGLVFVAAGRGSGTIGNHWLYCYGSYEKPTENINGHLISIPIELPTGKQLRKFYADFKTVPNNNKIVFSILDKQKKHIMTIKDGDSINLGERADERIFRLRANLSADNISVNPELAYWAVSFTTDNDPPNFVKNSFRPNPGGWINITKPTCTIEVWDNNTGLNLGSAYYEIGYYENNTNLKKYEEPAKYIGVNGTKFSTLTANISALNFADNITKLDSIKFEIRDYANNIGSITIKIKQDNTKPTSKVNSQTDGGEFKDNYLVITATASDPSGDDVASGIASVNLYYRYSNDKPSWSDWIEFGEPVTSAPYKWSFTDVEQGGYYELYTIATDEAENVEDAPESGDVSFILDNEPPDIPDISGQHWFKELPEISIEFSDDFLLNSVEYKPETETEWILIKSNINKATYDSEWILSPQFWSGMQSVTEYILEFRIKDTLDNTRIIKNNNGYKIYKDESKPTIDLEIHTLEDTYTIFVNATDKNGSGIKSVELSYLYSEDGNFNETWKSYGILTSDPFEWEFEPDEGNGYYKLKAIVEDLAGNVKSEEKEIIINPSFPTLLVIAMIILLITLILITFVIFIKWRKK
jgi:outer membrane protein assembly factor BamB